MRLQVLLAAVLVSCTTTVAAPSPSATASTASASPSPTLAPTATSVPASPSASGEPRIALSNAPLPEVAGKWVLFQMLGEARLRAIAFDGQANGAVGIDAPTPAFSQSPYGIPVVVGMTAHGRSGPLGTVPWPELRFTWSNDGRFLCAVTAEPRQTGAPLRLETAFIGQPKKLIATGFGTYSDNAGYPVLACDEQNDLAIVAANGQGLFTGQVWVFRLSTGALLRTYPAPSLNAVVDRWVVASPDATLLAESVTGPPDSGTHVVIRRAVDGTELASFDGFKVRGFSGDGQLVVAQGNGTVGVIDWATNRTLWSRPGQFGGHVVEPAGRRLAVGIGFVSGTQRDLYLVDGDRSSMLLPTIGFFSPRGF